MDRPPSNRPARRAGSGRFPVKVSIDRSDANPSDLISPVPTSASSIRQQPAPPIPNRSHQRVISQSQYPQGLQNGYANDQNQPVARRPAITPLAIGNERLRSNSESVLQATKNKRMGMVTRKTSDLGSASGLGTVDEARTSRYSHFRGLSHGSVMHENKPNGSTIPGNAAGETSSSPASSVERGRSRAHFVRRLSSLPEHKPSHQTNMDKPDPVVEASKGLLYSLYLVHPYINDLMPVIRGTNSKRTSLERVFYNALTHIEELDREIQRYNNYSREDEEGGARTNEGVKGAAVTVVTAYQHVCSGLQLNAGRLVNEGDPRYVRSLLLIIFSSLVEVRNACAKLAEYFQEDSTHGETSIASIKKNTPRKVRDRSMTPTRERPNPGQGNRGENMASRVMNDQSTPLSGSLRPLKISSLSRTSSISSSSTIVPKSAESSRSNTMLNGDYPKLHGDYSREDQLFERIFLKLRTAYSIVLKVLPTVKQQFVRCIEVCEMTETKRELRLLWTSLDQRCSYSMQMAEAVKTKMSTMNLRDSAARSQREFWQLCTTFVRAFVETAMLVKDARSYELIPKEIFTLIRPISKAVKEVGILIEQSPWDLLTTPVQAQPITHAMIQAGLQQQSNHHPGGTNGMQESTLSPYVSPLPATPLSAALGPAAQATIPSSASSARRQDPLFAGNVFERAESLLSQHSRTMTSSVADSRGQIPTLLSPNGLRNNYRPH
ncbi:MAG: hypothetical protein M4579_005954 [Chaenotheca gracillima]|nr:MAG: hypothetical protein M4579_005954 [Chaenotheca gracillima]